MQFSEKWLRSYVNPKWSTEKLSEELTMAGLEVEDCHAAAPAFSKVVVAAVVSVVRHPNADKLNVCEVDAGEGSLRQIVCGAPNVAVGVRVPCAMPGAVLPGNFEIKPMTMRGVESAGMLCSASELKISEESSGLLLLPENAPIGQSIRDYLSLDDQIFTIKLTPNRPDCLGVVGIAREVSALSGEPLCTKPIQAVVPTIQDKLAVSVEAADLCGRFAGRIIKGVNAKAPTPDWMRLSLERAGQRSISALVDISNYVMLELSRPTHVFDLSKISGDLTVRWAKKGESLKLLNGNTVELDGNVGVICDAHQVESLAGIMGGDSTAVSLETKDIFLEAAFWWPKAIAGRARRFNFSTDAGHRFERGVDAQNIPEHLDYITGLILDICGGAAGPATDIVKALPERRPVTMRIARAQRIIGAPILADDIKQSFARLGFDFTQTDLSFTVTPPSFRFDINIEEDLIEEVVRLWGFNNLPQRAPVATALLQPAPEAVSNLYALKRAVAARDYQEVVNFSFVGSALNAELAQSVAEGAKVIPLQNPIATHLDVMRSTLWASLIENLKTNLNRKSTRVRLFEVGRVFARDDSAVSGPLSVKGIYQPKKLALLAYGAQAAEQWGTGSRGVDFFDVKADLESLFGRSLPRLDFTPTQEHEALHPGRSARLSFAGSSGLSEVHQVGWMGELHPRLQNELGLPSAPILIEIDLDVLLARDIPSYSPMANTPVIERDLALLVQVDLPSKALLQQIHVLLKDISGSDVVKNITLFDEYRGKGLENKEKSLAIRFSMQDTVMTLNDAQVSAVLDQLVAALTSSGTARMRA
jgi:phenylalanyl-tRNA synthetase beta chain